MDCSLRVLTLEEVPLIAGIDSSEEVTSEYAIEPLACGLGLRLVLRQCQPTRQVSKWGERELRGRFALWYADLEEGALLFGAFQDERLVGFTLVAPVNDAADAELLSIFVDRCYRRRGIGSALLGRAEQQARAWGCQHFIVYTTPEAGAVRFYTSAGYRLIGVTDSTIRTKNFALTFARVL